MGHGVEGVEVGEEASREFLKVLRSRRYVGALYSQLKHNIDSITVQRLVTIADFKTCEEGVVYRERGVVFDRYLFKSLDKFTRVFRGLSIGFQGRLLGGVVGRASTLRPTGQPCGFWTAAPLKLGGGIY